MHDPTESIQEDIHHHATHGGGGHGDGPQWITAAALTAAILAALAAVSGAMATKHLTESTHSRIDANDRWSYYQSKSLKNYLLQAKNDIVEATVPEGQIAPAIKAKLSSDKKKIAENEADKEKTSKEAKGFEELSEKHLITHETYELSATMFHISIAVVAIAVVAKRKSFWLMSLIGGVIGCIFLGRAISIAPAHAVEREEEIAVHAASATPGEHAAPSHEATEATTAEKPKAE